MLHVKTERDAARDWRKEMMGVGYLKNNTFILKYNNKYIYIEI